MIAPLRAAWRPRFADVVLPLLLALGLVVMSKASFLWFHVLAELFAIVIGLSLYLIASESHVFNRNGFLLFLAQGFFWAACVDVVHTLAYAGMGMVKGNDPNPATQLWLLARAIEAVALLLAPRFLSGREVPAWSSAAIGGTAAAGIALIFGGHLPAAFVPGQGLTPFKVGGEYLIVSILAAAAWHLWWRRHLLDADLYRIMLGVVALTIVSELAFTVYVGVYDLSNLVGHIFKFWAFWLLLLAITRWMLARPFRLLSRNAHSFDHMPMPVLLTDSAGVIQAGNAAARRRHPDGGAGQALHDVWHPATLATDACPVCDALAAGQPIETELHDARADRWAAIRLSPIALEGGAQGFVCVQSDVTEEHQARERLMQADKMEAIGQLTGGLAHDFNNLLGVVLGGLALLESRLGDDEKARQHLDLARRGARGALDVTRSLLAVARRQALEPRDIAIDAVLADFMPLLHSSAGKGVAIELVGGADCAGLRVRVDPAGLGNALLNLVINARDAMPAGGRLTIETRRQTIVPRQPGAAPELHPGDYLVIGVSDSGGGMPPDVAARAFEPFFTTKEKGRGTGLGLAMVHGFARQSGGTATLYSEAGVGTTIRLYLPVVAAATAPMPARAAAVPGGRGERVLVVDDEKDMLAIASEWLNELGYRVIRAGDPAQALALLASQPCDALFTDLMMPGGIDGIALARRARERHPGLRVLFASGYAGEGAETARPLLSKPYNRDDLAIALRRLFDAPPPATSTEASS